MGIVFIIDHSEAGGDTNLKNVSKPRSRHHRLEVV